LKKSLLPLLFILHCSQALIAQFTRYTVQFTDKSNSSYSLSDPSKYLSSRALERRSKQGIGIDSNDLPINADYIDSLATIPNLIVLNHSKWLNQVLVSSSDPAAIAKINSLPFVKKISPVALSSKKLVEDSLEMKIKTDQRVSLQHRETIRETNQQDGIQTGNNIQGNALNYGNSFAQIHIHEGEYLHNLGFRGQGMVIAILDAGFNSYLSNPAFDSLRQNNRVLGTYDYVHAKASVNDEDIHGAYCLSIIAANEPGIITGSATGASFWLLKTEDTQSEYPIEEQYWTVAAEFADSAGADMISTSLGYDYFDDPSLDLNYSDRDGNSSLITIAANIAVSKGMIVTASAGNSGTASGEVKFIGCPADGDSVLAIGAINVQGDIAAFSSWGPNSAGRIKPDLVSVGQGTVIASASGAPSMGDGTSFSNPNLAGLIACLWEAFPEFSNHDISTAVVQSADRYSHPDERYGYGIPNFRIAYQTLIQERALRAYANRVNAPWISVYPVPFSAGFSVVFRPSFSGNALVSLLDAAGKLIESKSIAVTANQLSEMHFSRSYSLAKGVYFIRYDDGHQQKTLKTIRQ
jgi:serine protease AprX